MTVATTTQSVSYAGNGSQLTFPYGFLVLVNTDLIVQEVITTTGIATTLTLGGQYSVTGTGNPTGGNVVLVTATPSGSSLVITRNTSLTQSVDYVEHDKFPAETHEAALDKLTLIVQDNLGTSGRALKVPTSDINPVTTLPPAASRVGKFLYFDSLGNPTVSAQINSGTLSFTPQSQTFSGDGATTAFTLANAPGSADAVIISISGVTQKPNADFSVSGVTVTFTTAPVTGVNNILVQNFGVALAVPVAGDVLATGTLTTESLEDRFARILYVEDFIGAGATDHAIGIQAAIVAAETIGNGTVVQCAARRYTLKTALRITKGIFLRADGYGDVTTSTSNIMSTAASGTTLQWDTGAGAGVMIQFKAALNNETLHGGGLLGLLIDANNTAATCVKVSSCRHTTIDVTTYRPTTNGLLLDDTNNRLCAHVYIPRYIARIGSDAAAAGARGVYIKGDVSVTAFGCTQHYFGEVDIEYENGDAFTFEDCDSCVVAKLHNGKRTGGGTGRGVYFSAGDGAFVAQKNVILHGSRLEKVVADATTIANRIMYMNSEGGSVDNGGSTGALIYDVADRVHGDMFTGSIRYPMSLRLDVPLGGFLAVTGTPVAAGIGGFVIYSVAFDAAATETIGLTIPAPFNFNNGTITGAFVTAVSVGTVGGDWRIQLDLVTRAAGASIGSVEKTEAFTVTPSGTTNVINQFTLTFASALAYTRGDTIGIQFSRLGADGADTRVNDMALVGLQLIYKCTGPDSQAATWDVPANQLA